MSVVKMYTQKKCELMLRSW